jgi:regulation of enolase protein 1 (concanavalin A-like superfamily)
MDARIRPSILCVLGLVAMVLCPRQAQAQATASFVGFDTTTEGNWQGAYGTDGYSVSQDSQSLPGYATFSVQNQANYTWASSTSDVRALQRGSGSGRLAACWYGSDFTFSVDITDGNTHPFALYALDWDSQSRSETVQISDAGTGAVLDTENASSFVNGVYLIWNISGNVNVTVTLTGGANAVISGAFFGGTGSGGTAPTISSLSPSSGPAGTSVTITGTNFGSTQGTLTFNGVSTTATSWNNTTIVAPVPAGATTGPVAVMVAGVRSNSFNFIVTVGSWQDTDIGSVGVAGSTSYANGVFTVQGAGAGVENAADAMNFLYQSLPGDGTIIARVVNFQGSSTPQLGVMIRETLTAGATDAFPSDAYNPYYGNELQFLYRASTGGGTQNGGSGGASLPFWLELTRTGNTFTAYYSPDGVSWTQYGTETVTMAQNVYVGLAVSSESTSSLATVTFDNVSIGTPSSPAPEITSVLPDGGAVGSQAVISGSGFGATQGNSIVTLNDIPVAINSWSDSSITFTIPAGASSGLLAVAVAPNMNSSNAVTFLVGSQTLSSWMEADVGAVGVSGSASYANGVFTVQAAGGAGIDETAADAMNFLYQPLSGNGTIIARVVSLQGQEDVQLGVMVRETLAAGATNAFSSDAYNPYYGNGLQFLYRASTDGIAQNGGSGAASLPFWLELTRNDNTFTAYYSSDGINWTQYGTETVTMAQNAYVGLAVSSESTSSLATVTFDNVSIGTPTIAAPVITNLSVSEGPVGTPVAISGHGFGANQGNSLVILNDTPVTISSWSDTLINITIPSGAVSGPLAVIEAPNANASNPVYFTIASEITPVISALAPPSNALGGSVALIGSGFGTSQGSSTVQFNGVAAAATSWTANSVTVTVPQTATSGPVTLTLGSDGATSNGVQFTVVSENFSISGISPTTGQPGTVVTISGTGFGTGQTTGNITFNGITASVVTWTDTAIMAAVPAGATSGPVAVENAEGPTFTVGTTATLTDSLGNQTAYNSTMAGGKWYITSAQGSGCSSV